MLVESNGCVVLLITETGRVPGSEISSFIVFTWNVNAVEPELQSLFFQVFKSGIFNILKFLVPQYFQ